MKEGMVIEKRRRRSCNTTTTIEIMCAVMLDDWQEYYFCELRGGEEELIPSTMCKAV